MRSLGDFNDIRNHQEKIGGQRKDQRKIDGFIGRDCPGRYRIQREMHTWSNNRGRVERVEERLDRVLANELWCAQYH